MGDDAWFAAQAEAYALAAAGTEWPLDPTSLYPCLDDIDAPAGTLPAHYGFQDLWAASQVIWGRQPLDRHVDVGSRLDGFITHLLAGNVRVTYVDVRPLNFTWPGFDFRQDDAATLATFADNSIESLSCLHVAEHLGLYRYSRDIDPLGMNKAMASLARVLAPGGRLYFACPIGRQRVVFNAHRVASPSWVISTFAKHGLTLRSFAAVDDVGAWHPEVRPVDYEGASYACGCFAFTKGAA
jgi:SAM-dependent methyltransferase